MGTGKLSGKPSEILGEGGGNLAMDYGGGGSNSPIVTSC